MTATKDSTRRGHVEAARRACHASVRRNDAVTRVPGELLSVHEAAERLNVPLRFIRRLIFERRIPFYKVGRYVRIASADLDTFVHTSRIEPDDTEPSLR